MITGNEPINVTFFADGSVNSEGLTIRQHFAAMALQGLLTRKESVQSFTALSEEAVMYADALIYQLNQK